jgi:ABC-type transport system involved in cytochrome c biogenesis permease component
VKYLLAKDFRNLKSVVLPALFLGIPLILILQFTTESTDQGLIHPLSAYWVVYFFSAVALLYRSFSAEHRYSTFIVYSALGVSRLKIFLSQALFQWIGLVVLGAIYGALIHFFWPSVELDWKVGLTVLALVSLCLAPLGSLLGLMLQTEREFLFSVFFLPLCTPVLLGAHSLCQEWSQAWFSVLAVFALMGGFVSALLFEFFFDELTQSH